MQPSSSHKLLAQWQGPGERLLLLQSSSSHKLLAQWQGPFEVLRKMENDINEIQLPRRKTILHINVLKKFVKRVEIVAGVLIADVGDSDRRTTTINVQKYQTSTNVKYVLKLVNTQRR